MVKPISMTINPVGPAYDRWISAHRKRRNWYWKSNQINTESVADFKQRRESENGCLSFVVDVTSVRFAAGRPHLPCPYWKHCALPTAVYVILFLSLTPPPIEDGFPPVTQPSHTKAERNCVLRHLTILAINLSYLNRLYARTKWSPWSVASVWCHSQSTQSCYIVNVR